MLARQSIALVLVLPLCSPILARADESHTVEENGVTYMVTTRTVHRPICETHYEDRQQTVYAEQLQTQIQSTQRIVQAPVMEWVYQPYWVNRFNPFAQPYLAYRYVPRVRWDTRTEQVLTPIVQRQVVPQQQTVKVPVTTPHFVDDTTTSKVAIAVKSDPFAAGGTGIAQRSPAGGTPLNDDPPRGSTAWKAPEQK
jgi:hypothetical protein